MRVLILSDTYPDDNNPTPGIFIHNQVKALQSKRVDVIVLVFDMRSIRRKRKLGFYKYQYDGVCVYRYAIPCGPIPYLLEILSVIATKKGFRKVVNLFGMPDLIHAHFALAGYCSFRLKRKYKIPYSLTEHASSLIEGNLNRRNRYISKIAYNNADFLISVGSVLKNRMSDLTKNKINIIHNILPSYYQIKNIKKNEDYTFITVGLISYRKRMDLIINAFSKLQYDFKNIKLIVVGEGPLLNELKCMCRDLKIEELVDFMGMIHNPKLPEVYQRCHCFVLPSNMETFGVVYAEAAACGLPIIATNCGGPSDIVNETNGLMISRDNEEALYDAMKYMIINKDKYSSNDISKEALDKFGEKVISEKLITAYRGILNDNR